MSQWRGVSVKTKPTGELITLASLKQRLRIDFDDDDALLGNLLKGAIARVDGPNGIGVALMEQTWRKSLDHFPAAILLPGAPIKNVTSISYIDSDGAAQTMDAADYRVDILAEPVRIEPAFGKSWPAARHVVGAVTVEYLLGETDVANVPEDLIDAVCLLVGHRYEHREAVAMGDMASIPLGFETIVNEHRRGSVAA